MGTLQDRLGREFLFSGGNLLEVTPQGGNRNFRKREQVRTKEEEMLSPAWGGQRNCIGGGETIHFL